MGKEKENEGYFPVDFFPTDCPLGLGTVVSLPRLPNEDLPCVWKFS